jgi:UPF0042 nucleotide-binding protein
MVSDCLEDNEAMNPKADSKPFQLKIVSFGFKKDLPPEANLIFDVRFLQNPYWVAELRERTGLEKPVQNYVLGQSLAAELIDACDAMLQRILPLLAQTGVSQFTLALGCTGGQHRSVAVTEAMSRKLRQSFPDYMIEVSHRELDAPAITSQEFFESPIADTCKASVEP